MSVLFKVGFNSTFTRLISEHLERNGNREDSFQTVVQKGLALFGSAVSGLSCDVLHRATSKLKIKPVSAYLSSPHRVSKDSDHLCGELLWESKSGMENNGAGFRYLQLLDKKMVLSS